MINGVEILLKKVMFSMQVGAFKTAGENLDTSTSSVNSPSRCKEIMLHEYSERLQELKRVLDDYKDLVEKDCREISDAVKATEKTDEENAGTWEEVNGTSNSPSSSDSSGSSSGVTHGGGGMSFGEESDSSSSQSSDGSSGSGHSSGGGRSENSSSSTGGVGTTIGYKDHTDYQNNNDKVDSIENSEGKVTLTEEELDEIRKDAYKDGFMDGFDTRDEIDDNPMLDENKTADPEPDTGYQTDRTDNNEMFIDEGVDPEPEEGYEDYITDDEYDIDIADDNIDYTDDENSIIDETDDTYVSDEIIDEYDTDIADDNIDYTDDESSIIDETDDTYVSDEIIDEEFADEGNSENLDQNEYQDDHEAHRGHRGPHHGHRGPHHGHRGPHHGHRGPHHGHHQNRPSGPQGNPFAVAGYAGNVVKPLLKNSVDFNVFDRLKGKL